MRDVLKFMTITFIWFVIIGIIIISVGAKDEGTGSAFTDIIAWLFPIPFLAFLLTPIFVNFFGKPEMYLFFPVLINAIVYSLITVWIMKYRARKRIKLTDSSTNA